MQKTYFICIIVVCWMKTVFVGFSAGMCFLVYCIMALFRV
jgi:hypothetical protein